LVCKDLDTVRSFFFANVSRDRGPRAVLEAGGSVLVLFYLSWRLGPILAGRQARALGCRCVSEERWLPRRRCGPGQADTQPGAPRSRRRHHGYRVHGIPIQAADQGGGERRG
jgi:hypothetical protein